MLLLSTHQYNRIIFYAGADNPAAAVVADAVPVPACNVPGGPFPAVHAAPVPDAPFHAFAAPAPAAAAAGVRIAGVPARVSSAPGVHVAAVPGPVASGPDGPAAAVPGPVASGPDGPAAVFPAPDAPDPVVLAADVPVHVASGPDAPEVPLSFCRAWSSLSLCWRSLFLASLFLPFLLLTCPFLPFPKLPLLLLPLPFQDAHAVCPPLLSSFVQPPAAVALSSRSVPFFCFPLQASALLSFFLQRAAVVLSSQPVLSSDFPPRVSDLLSFFQLPAAVAPSFPCCSVLFCSAASFRSSAGVRGFWSFLPSRTSPGRCSCLSRFLRQFLLPSLLCQTSFFRRRKRSMVFSTVPDLTGLCLRLIFPYIGQHRLSRPCRSLRDLLIRGGPHRPQ